MTLLDQNSQIKAVLFDLDGTLLDTARDFWESLNQLRAEENLEPLLFETVRCQVSHGGHALVRLGFGKLPGDLRFRLFGREWFIPLATTIILSLAAGLISKLI